jgi:tetrahydrodipicolinate N-succinyltransferase
MMNLKSKLIRLAYERPELRKDLLPLVSSSEDTRLVQAAKSFNIPGVHIFDDARVSGEAKVYGNAKVYANAHVFDNSYVYEGAKVYGYAKVYGKAEVYGKAQVYDKT